MKSGLFSICGNLAIGTFLMVSCADIDPKMTNDTLPLLPNEVEQGTIVQLDYGELLAFPGAKGMEKIQ